MFEANDFDLHEYIKKDISESNRD